MFVVLRTRCEEQGLVVSDMVYARQCVEGACVVSVQYCDHCSSRSSCVNVMRTEHAQCVYKSQACAKGFVSLLLGRRAGTCVFPRSVTDSSAKARPLSWRRLNPKPCAYRQLKAKALIIPA